MNISNLLIKENIVLNLNATNKLDAFTQLSSNLLNNNCINNQEKYISALLKREKEFSTNIGFGIAIPHAKDTSVNKASIAIGTFTNGLDYEDGETPVKLMFLLAVPTENDNLHLEILKRLSRKIIDANFRESLLSANSVDDIFKIMETI